jgi:hypothetical protein
MSNVTASIENNPFKQKTRLAIIQQAKEWEKQGNPIQAQTLPAEHWLFERELLKACPDAEIEGFECDGYKYRKSKAFLESFATSKTPLTLKQEKITGFSYLGGGCYAPANFVWFDYCGTPYGGKKWGFSRMEEPAAVIKALLDNEEDGLVYVTYCMIGRHMTVEKMAATIWNNLSLEGAIKRKLWSLIGTKSGEGVHIVFEAKYLGGEMQKTPMYTIGFQVGKKTVTPFNADWTVEVKQARQAAHAAKYGGDYIPPEQLAKVEAMIAEAKSECLRIEELKKSLRMITLTDKDLIRFGHKQGLSTAAIHQFVKATDQWYVKGAWKRYVTRRNVGATVAWL